MSLIPSNKSMLTGGIEETEKLDRSPFMRGIIAGSKGALLGAPVAGFVQALRGKDPVLGAVLGALGMGLLFGTSKAMEQDIANQVQEGRLRYYADRLKNREPFFFMPPAEKFGPLFSKLHEIEHQKVERARAVRS